MPHRQWMSTTVDYGPQRRQTTTTTWRQQQGLETDASRAPDIGMFFFIQCHFSFKYYTNNYLQLRLSYINNGCRRWSMRPMTMDVANDDNDIGCWWTTTTTTRDVNEGQQLGGNSSSSRGSRPTRLEPQIQYVFFHLFYFILLKFIYKLDYDDDEQWKKHRWMMMTTTIDDNAASIAATAGARDMLVSSPSYKFFC